MLRRTIAAMILLIVLAPVAGRAQEEPPYILIDADSGAVLADHRAGDLWYPASLTKLMTIYLVFEALRDGRLALDSPVEISPAATAEPPSAMGFPAGTVITVDNALKILVVKSANDVAVAVAEMMAGSVRGFVAEMNSTAARLGLTGTHFVNPHGLPGAGQHTTARDIAALGRLIWSTFPEYRDVFGIGAISYGEAVMPSGNTLLAFYPGASGLKTGYICSSGFNIAGLATRGETTLIVVVLGELSELSRAERAAELLDRGFDARAAVGGGFAIDSYVPPSSTAAPVDLRPVVCPPGAAVEEATDLVDPVEPVFIHGLLVVPPVPVPVYTGGADPDARIRVDIPLPLPKPPPYPPDALGVILAASGPVTPFPLPRPSP